MKGARVLAVTMAVAGLLLHAEGSLGLSLAPEEFQASRKMACVLAEESLGKLTPDEYGARAHALLDGFDETERGNILAKALGYYDGLMFSVAERSAADVTHRLQEFVDSSTCISGYSQVTFEL